MRHRKFFYKKNRNKKNGGIKPVIKNNNNQQLSVASFLQKFSIATKFSDAANKEAAHFRDDVFKEIKNRSDFRDLNSFTIDPDDARDFDDALSVKKIDDQKYEIGVHIADVTYWVKKNSGIDKDAKERCNSFYFPWGSVPMLPQVLTADICSLVPNKDRLAVSCVFFVNGTAITGHKVVLSVINSKKRLTYNDAQNILDGKEGYEPWLYESLGILSRICANLRELRNQSGALDFDLPEYGFTLNGQFNPVDYYQKPRMDSNKLVEDYMLEANTAIAADLKKAGTIFIYRNHAKPPAANIAEFENLCKAYNLKINGKNHKTRLASALKITTGKLNSAVIHKMLLRTMSRAKYEVNNVGHFGLGIKEYTHFTSPIRRYSDITIHRAVKEFLINKNKTPKKQNIKMIAAEQNAIATNCNTQEDKALKAEREAAKILGVLYLKDKEGAKFNGIISGIGQYGVFVSIANSPIEGLINRRDLPRDYYLKDNGLYNRRNMQMQKKVGDSIEIVLKKTDTQKMFIDFIILQK